MQLSERTESIIRSHDWLTPRRRPPADPTDPRWLSRTTDGSENRHRAGLTDNYLWRPCPDLRRSRAGFPDRNCCPAMRTFRPIPRSSNLRMSCQVERPSRAIASTNPELTNIRQ